MERRETNKEPYLTSEGEFLRVILGKNEAIPITQELLADRREVINEVLETLTPTEKRASQLRFGLLDARTRTMREVGEEFGVSYGTARRVVDRAIRKLRHPARLAYLELLLPVGEENLLYAVWGVRYGLELRKRFPVYYPGLKLEALNLPEQTLQELKEKIVIPKNQRGGLGLRDLLHKNATNFSDKAQQDLFQGLERLQEEVNRTT